MNNSKEYELLRGEIQEGIKTAENYKAIMYSATAAIYAFAIGFKEPMAYLLTLFIIIPVYLQNVEQTLSTLRIGAYLYVFIEGVEFNWETRLKKFDDTYKSKSPPINPYISLSAISTILVFAFQDYSMKIHYILFRLGIAVLAFIISAFIIRIKQINYLTEKQKYIHLWMEIKKMEEDDLKKRSKDN